MINIEPRTLRSSLSLMLLAGPESQPMRYYLASLAAQRGVPSATVGAYIERVERFAAMHDALEPWASMVSKQFALLCDDICGGKRLEAQVEYRARGVFDKQHKIHEERQALTDDELNELRAVLASCRGRKMSRTQRSAHERYGKSSIWSKKRLDVLHAARWACSSCGAQMTDGPSCEVHHLTYSRPGIEREGFDVVAMCKRCHDKRHDY